MAVFNPEPQAGQVNDPNYFKYSEPTKDIKADTSTGLALTGAAADIEGGVSSAYGLTKQYIEKDVKDTIDPIRDNFTKSLEAARANLVPNAVQTGTGGTVSAASYADGEDHTALPVPDAVKNGVSKVQGLQDAYVNGKVNDTWYHGQLATAVTGLRSKYAGFTDYIDTEVSKITGVVPANAYVADLMQDLNRVATNKKTEQDKLVDVARGAMSKGFDKADQMYQRLQQDPSFGPAFMQWYTEENAKDTALSRDTAALQNQNLHGDQAVKSWKQNLSAFVSSKIDGDLNATVTLNGMSKPEKIMDILQKVQADPKAYSGEQMEEFATKLQIHQNTMKTQLATMINRNPNYRVLDPAQRDAEVDSQLKSVYGSMYDAIKGGGAAGAGAAFFIANQFRATMDQTKFNLTQGDLGKAATNFEILSQKLGPAMAGQLVPSFLKAQSNLPDNLKALFGEKVMEAHAQPGGDNNPTTLAGHMSKIGNDDRISPTDKAYVYKGLINTVNDLKNPNLPDEDKANIARYLFDPNNNGVLQQWKMDYKTTSPDGRLQVIHPGKYAVWTQLTDKDVTNEMGKLDAKSQSYYRNWVDITGRELIGTDVKNLNHFTGHDNLYFDWKNTGGTPQLVLRDKEGGLASPVGRSVGAPQYGIPSGTATPDARPIGDGYRMQVQAVVDRINTALPNLEHVYKKFGGNTETMLLQTLQQYGMDFNGHVSGLPKSFGDAVAASRKAPEKKSNE